MEEEEGDWQWRKEVARVELEGMEGVRGVGGGRRKAFSGCCFSPKPAKDRSHKCSLPSSSLS